MADGWWQINKATQPAADPSRVHASLGHPLPETIYSYLDLSLSPDGRSLPQVGYIFGAVERMVVVVCVAVCL